MTKAFGPERLIWGGGWNAGVTGKQRSEVTANLTAVMAVAPPSTSGSEPLPAILARQGRAVRRPRRPRQASNGHKKHDKTRKKEEGHHPAPLFPSRILLVFSCLFVFLVANPLRLDSSAATGIVSQPAAALPRPAP